METFQLFIDDDRYSVTTFNLIAVRDADSARDCAEMAMRESPHHRGVEVCLGGAWLFGFGTLAERNHNATARELVGFST